MRRGSVEDLFEQPDAKVHERGEDSDGNSESGRQRRYKLPNLCDPAQGQLFPNFDRHEDWDEFEDARKDQILSRFRVDTEKRNKFTDALNKFVSRMYRLDGSIVSIVPG